MNATGMASIEFIAPKTKRDILRLFLSPKNGTDSHYQREISYITGCGLHAVQCELKKLVKAVLLSPESRNGKKYYKINSNFPSLNELKSIFNGA